MIITYLGDGCFRLESGKSSLLVDPSTNRFKADVILRTTSPTTMEIPVGEDVAFPGEYEMKGFEIVGFPIGADSNEKTIRTAYVVRYDDIACAFLGALRHAPDPELMEKIGEPDVLCMVLDGDETLSADLAAKMVKQIGPHVAVVNAARRGQELQKALGQKDEAHDKFVFKLKDITTSVERIVLLKS